MPVDVGWFNNPKLVTVKLLDETSCLFNASLYGGQMEGVGRALGCSVGGGGGAGSCCGVGGGGAGGCCVVVVEFLGCLVLHTLM